MKTNCIRCEKEFENPTHPLAHFSTICNECKKIEPESISDQQKFNIKPYFEPFWLKLMTEKHSK